MAKSSMIQRDLKRTKLCKRYDEKRKKLKQMFNETSDFEEKINFQAKLQALPRNSAKCRQRNRCWFSGRSRGFYRDFGLSRHVLREMAHQCLLPGVTKSSW